MFNLNAFRQDTNNALFDKIKSISKDANKIWILLWKALSWIYQTDQKFCSIIKIAMLIKLNKTKMTQNTHGNSRSKNS